MATQSLQADSACANALQKIEKLADDMRTAIRRIHSLAGAINDASEVMERHAGELSEPRRREHIGASERLYHYRALIEDLTDPAVDHAEEIERLCSQLKRGEKPTEPQDHSPAEIAAARSRWGLGEARAPSSRGE
jgi:chromosome segregation ATPase